MKKFNLLSIPEDRWAGKFISVILFVVFISLSDCIYCQNKVGFANNIEAYRVKWWYIPTAFGMPPNPAARPIYGVINIDNGVLTVRHAILEGRELGDYRLPYWPVTSFVSIFSKTAELAHQSSVTLIVDGKKKTFPFRCGDPKSSSSSMNSKRIEEGFDLAHIKDADVLKVTNKGSESPILMEHSLVVTKGSFDIPVFIKATNTSDQTIQDVVVQVSYGQDFNWSSFGTSDSQDYQQIEAPASGESKAFFAFSSGMKRGYEFHQTEGCELSYKISREMNAWKVIFQNTSRTLAPGASMVFRYDLRVIDKPLVRTSGNKSISKQEFDLVEFTKIKPTVVKTEPVNPVGRVTVQDVIRNLDKPKLRGVLHDISGFPQILTDLATLKDWGGNLASTLIENPDETRQIMEFGHKLGMKMFITSENSYSSGIPLKLDRLFAANLKPAEYPDSYGQNEDHNTWYAVKPTLDFVTEFGKPMSASTQEEKVRYWSRCFVDKWFKTLAYVRQHDPGGNIWFDIPSPSVAYVDPLDYHKVFLSEVKKLGDLGDEFTIFPFYYGPDYNHIEYMMRMWKDAGFPRAVFRLRLPSFPKPSQFLRALTAARRGGSDGAAARYIRSDAEGRYIQADSSGSKFTFWGLDEWRWKSLLLAAHANFPTPELKAYCFIEEPAELVEALAVSDVNVYSVKSDEEDFIQRLKKLVPGKVKLIKSLPKNPPKSGQINLVIGEDATFNRSEWVYDIQRKDLGINKGVIQMRGNIVRLNGPDTLGLANAETLFLRFAELAISEKISGSKH